MLWICAAHPQEVEGFGQLSSRDVRTLVLGVGQYAALATFAAEIQSKKPDGVILLGTCGAEEDLNLMKILKVQHFAYPSISDEELPEFLPRAWMTENTGFATGLTGATVLQNHGISMNAAKFRANQGYIPEHFPRPILENMEAASVSAYCRERDIPFTALLAVSNVIGPEARRQWKANFRDTGLALGEIAAGIASSFNC
jgi:nucleoside phosphorylase